MQFKSTVYRQEWLELVFENRNKEYGAYIIRKEQSAYLQKGLLIAVFGFSLMILLFYAYNNFNDKPVKTADKIIDVKLDKIFIPKDEIVKPPEQQKQEQKQTEKVKLTDNIIVTKDELVKEEPPTIEKIKEATIASENSSGEKSIEINPIIETKGDEKGGLKSIEGNPNQVYDFVAESPEFSGGMKAWAKFLNNNLNYPAAARENNIQGRVILSFVIEKDGTLSQIKVVQGIGGGCDDEAIRVLKKAPKWTPGRQNGQAVRVQFTLPIYFKLN